MNLVVRVGDTVRRPPGPPAVVELLRWYEQVGFDGAPRYLGVDDEGREILSFVEGEPAFAPVPSSDEVIVGARAAAAPRAHDAQAGFAPAPLVIGHCDLFWTNVIFRDGLPAALIDWELARPVTRDARGGARGDLLGGHADRRAADRVGHPARAPRRAAAAPLRRVRSRRRRARELLDELIEYRRNRIATRRLAGHDASPR